MAPRVGSMRELSAVDEVPVPAQDPARLEAHVDPRQAASLRDAVATAARVLAGRTVWNVNSTAAGGGVAETLARVVGYLRGAGIDARWVTIEGDDDFFAITKRLHHHIHDSPGDADLFDDAERRHYTSVCARNAEAIAPRVQPADVVILHDPQTAGLVPSLAGRPGATLWRSHIGSEADTPRTQRAWQLLAPYINAADGWIFSSSRYAPAGRPVSIIPPSIDPFSPKNQSMDPDVAAAILARAGLVAGRAAGPDARPTYQRSDGTTGEVRRAARTVGPLPAPADALVVQVSRWDPLKDPLGVMRSFGRAVAQGLRAHLVLVGPDPTAIADDPEGNAVFRAAEAEWSALPDEARARVTLACVPQDDDDENAAIVNAVQRTATVVIQKSIAEGFGLTVTEAMWKGKPVVATRVGGIVEQIVDGEHGVLLPDPRDERALADALCRLLADRTTAAELGRRGRERVRTQFLDDRQLVATVNLCAGRSR